VQLDRFESELQVLSQQLVLDCESCTEEQYDALPAFYRSVLNGLSASHFTGVIEQLDQNTLRLYSEAGISERYQQALLPLQQCYKYANSSSTVDAQAWITLGLTGLALYVPNYPHDPALRPMIERKLYNEEKTNLVASLQALRQFQIGFTGQDSSLRIRQIEEAVRMMGDEPPVPAIVRPGVSELDALQGEFSNLLSVIQPLVSGSMSVREASNDNTLRQNIAHIIRRIEEGYRSYDDITAPAVGFLVCLNIGLTLGAKEQESDSDISRSLAYITHQTPFFGLHNWYNLPSSDVLMQFCEEQLGQKHAMDLRWHALHCLASIRTVDPGYLTEEKTRQLVHDIFSSFYGDWKTKLLQDQHEQAKNTSLYTYRGEEDDIDEEDPSLFPDYEKEEEDETQALTSTSREDVIHLTNMHAAIILGGSNSSDALKALLQWCAAEMNRVAAGKSHGSNYENALPAIYLSLEKKADALASPGAGKSYNFYFDANLPEAKRLITLIHRIQLRFRQILKVWPEHATLWDVLRTCDEALEFRHVDPVAKFITKAEKLHGYMYEWQRVASREFSAATLFDDLTRLMVGWRQLELTTWARLFDIETEKFRDNAKSWFFVAYETIIAAAESIENEKDMKMHARGLLKTMEGFFLSTTLGQYEQRIALLKQIQAHISMRIHDNAALKPVYLALENFIAYFSRLQKPVHEALVKGRQKLEKDVNDVIKLAGWKDTNIEALKQSAKTSHRKLSKLVRKFRNVLKQPVSGIVRAGFTEEGIIAFEPHMGDVGTAVNPEALALCATSIPSWSSLPTRFINLTVTVSMMRKLSSPTFEAIDGAGYISNFITELEASIIELQKATPNLLNDDNKETVQHLKTQKRKLYADTMKQLRQMGIKSNLSSDVLARQDELSTVLASVPTVVEGLQCGHAAELFLHKSLGLMDQVRQMAREHSGDLTANDVARSIGYLEGLLHATIRQRGMLSKAVSSLAELQSPTKKIAALCTVDQHAFTMVTDEQVNASATFQPSLAWLCAMLDTAADVVSAQAKLGRTSEVYDLVRRMRDWSAQLRPLVDGFDRLPDFSTNVWSEEHRSLDQSIKTSLSDLRRDFDSWTGRYPISRTVLKHIQPYVFNYPEVRAVKLSENERITLEVHSKEILSALDLVLGSMQDVEAALTDMPTSTDDATWLVKEEQALSTAISALHATQISDAINSILDRMHLLYEDDNLRAIAALFTAVQPIINQHLASHKYLVERFDALHCSTAKLLHRLSKSFIQVGTQGFCQPPDKSADDKPGKDEKLESGTGLGEGEGAEDISKDIEDDEDLEDLAQEQKGEREGSIEEQDDAVDMGDQDMEGETGEVAEKEDQGSDGEEGDDDVQSEVGSVDDLGPSAVDEKMWDEGGKEDDLKEREAKEDVGTENQDEQVASDEKEKEKEKSGEDGEKEDQEAGQEEDEEMEMEGEDQAEDVGAGETEKMDPHAKEEETLDLPEDLNMDGEDGEEKNDLGDDMDMGEDLPEDEQEAEAGAEPDTVDEEIGPEQEGEDEKDTTGHVEDEEDQDLDQQEEDEGSVDDDAVPLPDQNNPEDEAREPKDDNSDPNAEAGAGADANEEAHQNQKEQASASAANREDGDEGDSSEKQQESTAEDGTLGQTAQPDAGGRGEQPEESPETQSFKKLGDVLEKWYNQQKQISEAREKDETQAQQMDKDVDMAKADFEHLADEETQADTQALGTATEEQAKALDHDMAMAVDEEESAPMRPEDKDEEAQGGDQQDVEMEDAAPPQNQEPPPQSTTEGQPQTFIGEQKPFSNDEDAEMEDAVPLEDDDISDSSSLADVDAQLSLTHLDPSSAPTPEQARALWHSHESATHSLSLQLTESLRLILAPTLATKLRGDFRTGKRLNLKRIIPYIASGYKRDKIWLRRSMPSKRSYQVLIALDDSRSMRDGGAVEMGLKTLTLVTRSLAMLEVGEVSVVGFGDNINLAHEFDKPFTSEAGVKVFEQFGFGASKTNVRGLVERSLELFAEARQKGVSGVGEDLWQLMLVVSDGICDSHAEIQRLVRRAQEERVMIVFVIIDSSSSTPTTQPQQQLAATSSNSAESIVDPTAQSNALQQVVEPMKEKTSIMDLTSVDISPEGKIHKWKYMERFPFRYYLVVRDVRELPGVLAGALRQWFGEVAGSA
jgi:midasin